MASVNKTFSIANISIQASADTVEKKVGSLNGVRNVQVTISSNTMDVEYDPEVIDERLIIQAVRDCGYEAYTKEIPTVGEEPDAQSDHVLLSKNLIISFACAAAIGILHFVPLSFWPCVLIALFCCYNNFGMIQEAFVELASLKKPGAASIRLLAFVICLSAALVTGLKENAQGTLYLFTGCSILFFSALERKLIELSRIAAAHSVSEIKDSMPKTASVYHDRHERIAPVAEIQEDQIIMIRPDDVIPADGRVIRGFATMNESALTGMETPIEKSEGSYVYANSVCLSGSVEIKAERTGSATAMMRLASLAEKTASDDSFQSPFKSFGRYLLVYIIIAAIIAASGWLFSGKDILFALNVLLCVLCSASLRTLALSSENEVMSAATEAMKRHVIFRSVEALEMCGKTDYAVIESPGAVIDEELTVTDFIPASDMSKGRLEYIAYALESRSDRPFAKAITRYLRSRRMEATDLAEFTRLSRRGRHALQSLSSYRSYTYDEIVVNNIEHSEWEDQISSLREEGKRVLIFTENDAVIGIIAAAHQIIPDAKGALKELEKNGSEVYLFTEGSEDESRVLAEKLELENVFFDYTKEEKESLLASLDQEDTITTYIAADPDQISAEDIDIVTAINTGAEPTAAEAGIWLTRNRLSDFVYAFSLSKLLNERIARKQMSILIYHAIAVVVFGFLLPAVLPFSLPPVIALACALCALQLVIHPKETN